MTCLFVKVRFSYDFVNIGTYLLIFAQYLSRFVYWYYCAIEDQQKREAECAIQLNSGETTDILSPQQKRGAECAIEDRLAIGNHRATTGQPQGNIVPYLGPYLIPIWANIQHCIILIFF